jgi:hypothetical protein
MKWLENFFARPAMPATATKQTEEPLSEQVRREMIVELQQQTFRHCSPKIVGEITAWTLMLSKLGDDALVGLWEIECG